MALNGVLERALLSPSYQRSSTPCWFPDATVALDPHDNITNDVAYAWPLVMID